MTDPAGNSEFYFHSTSMFHSALLRETLRVSGETKLTVPLGQSLSANCYIAGVFPATARPFIG